MKQDSVSDKEIEWFWHGCKLQNIELLVNDFNFFDIEAVYEQDGRIKRGKFRLSELTNKV